MVRRNPVCWKITFTNRFGRKVTDYVCYGAAAKKRDVEAYTELGDPSLKNVKAKRISASEYLKRRK